MCNHSAFNSCWRIWIDLYGNHRQDTAASFCEGESISAIAQSLSLSRPTVRKYLAVTKEPVYQCKTQPQPQLKDFLPQLGAWLEIDSKLPKAQKRSARRMFEGLQAEGYRGAYDSVQRTMRK